MKKAFDKLVEYLNEVGRIQQELNRIGVDTVND